MVAGVYRRRLTGLCCRVRLLAMLCRGVALRLMLAFSSVLVVSGCGAGDSVDSEGVQGSVVSVSVSVPVWFPVESGSGGAPGQVTADSTVVGRDEPGVGGAVDPDGFFASCADAVVAGAAPLYEGDVGYRAELDPDGDGVACGRKSGSVRD